VVIFLAEGIESFFEEKKIFSYMPGCKVIASSNRFSTTKSGCKRKKILG